MARNPIWEVELIVHGPISAERIPPFNQRKGRRLHDFYSDIEIRPSRVGVEATVTTHASTQKLAENAAMLFFGRMLDVLALRINLPLSLALHDRRFPSLGAAGTRRRVSEAEWRSAFDDAWSLAQNKPEFLRSLGWFRKGLYTEDPFDAFLALWNSIEGTTSVYHPPISQGRTNGTKSQIWESFKAIWGECDSWPVVTGDKSWIDNNHEIRIGIAHGAKFVDIHEVARVLAHLPTIREVAHRFLTDWWDQKFSIGQNSLFQDNN